jgi:hypothetical protein
VKPRLAALLATLSLATATLAQKTPDPFPVEAQTALPDISALQGKMLVIRGFYRTAELHFAPSGTVEGSAEKGFGPGDGLIHVAHIEISQRSVTFTGDHPLMYYDAPTDALSFRTGWPQRRITIDLPPKADSASAAQAVWAVFYKPDESMLPGCTPEEKEFRKAALVLARKRPHYPASGLCLPFGERITNEVGQNTLAPKPLSTPDPAMPSDAPRDRKLKALVILGVVVDESGHAENIMVLQSQAYNFDLAR